MNAALLPSGAGGPNLVALLLAVQAVWGLAASGLYRDVDWIVLAWFGNDLVTLLIVVPLLLAGAIWWRRAQRPRAAVLLLAGLAYAVYNGLFYLLGATVNPALPLYAAIVTLSALCLLATALGEPGAALRASSLAGRGVRVAGIGLALIGLCLGGVWLMFWAAHVFTGAALPNAEPVFRLVAALDLAIIMPLLASGGILAALRRPWAALLAPMAALFGAFYLSVLTLNSVLLIRAGLSEAPGELPIWLPLLAALLLLSWVLLRAVSPTPEVAQ